MSNQVKPTLPKGTRDFGAKEVYRREYIVGVIKSVFLKFGFNPLETPTMENLSVLTGKYGNEGDQLLFKILNSGDYLNKTDRSELSLIESKDLTSQISEKGLRYDLTVPFARYVSANRGELTFPFKRYQIQPVWRADRPQKGRYREFYQCDADIIGTNSLLCEAEVVMMINEVLNKLGVKNFTVKINNRKVLEAICEVIGAADKFNEIVVAIDKLDKIGEEGVKKELLTKEISEPQLNDLMSYLSADNEDAFKTFELFQEKLTNNEGIEELKEVFSFLSDEEAPTFDVSLARGLSYYTGCIFEVVANDVNIGSISGGGRYDDLTNGFGLKDVSGVGFSFGLDRIYDVLEELKLFPEPLESNENALIIALDDNSFNASVPFLSKIRNSNIKCELYPDVVKMKKSMNYANKRGYKYVILVGEEEVLTGNLTLKNMMSGEQTKLNLDDIIKIINE